MSTTLNDTMDTAKSMLDSAKDGTEHAVTSARSTLFDGIHAAAGVISTLRGLELGDALALVGLARRRGPLASIALFGAGVAVGTGVGMLFAPMSGADVRRAILDRFKGVQQDAQRTIEKVEAGAKEIEEKAETYVGKAKDTVVSAERKLESTVTGGLETAKDTLKNKAESAMNAAKETTDEAKSMLASADPFRTPAAKGNETGNKGMDTGKASDIGNHGSSTHARH